MKAANKQLIIAETEHWVAVNKPAGMLSIPDREQSGTSLREILIARYGEIFTVHRLDKDTGGLILFAKNAETHKYLCKLFEEREVEKYYLGVVVGNVETAEGEINAPIGENPAKKGTMLVHRLGKASRTGYTVLENYPAYSLLKFRLHTGRTHQIRVHCKEIGHPLAADVLYGDGKPVLLSGIKKKYKLSKQEEAERPVISSLALHAYELRFADADGKAIVLQTPPPKEFTALFQQLKKIQ